MTPSRTLNPALRGLAILVLAALIASLVACADDDNPAGLDGHRDPRLIGGWLAGPADGDTFGAIVFTADTAAISRDLIAEGGSIELSLAADGSTTGRLFIPDPAVPDGSNDVVEDLAGTWTASDGVLTLSQPADTFLRDLRFEFRDDRLVADRRFGGVRVRVVLVKVVEPT